MGQDRSADTRIFSPFHINSKYFKCCSKLKNGSFRIRYNLYPSHPKMAIYFNNEIFLTKVKSLKSLRSFTKWLELQVVIPPRLNYCRSK